MELLAFMELLQKAAAYTSIEEREEKYDTSKHRGLECYMYLTADGHVSAETTGIAVSFSILPKS